MPRAKVNPYAGGRRRKRSGKVTKNGIKKGTVPVKSVAINADVSPIKVVNVRPASTRGRGITGRLVASMNLDEMLEASKYADMGLSGEKIPVVQSPKVQKYVGAILQLNKRDSTKTIAKKMQQDLTVRIVERNKRTTNAVEAKRLYNALMKEE